ncbi:MAG: response regulator [Phyllobacteriaceae bacterium]|nr:response regulator [Phyllobacteriaceae bacterium]
MVEDGTDDMDAMRRLHDVVAGNEDRLTARIIDYAKERGYTPFTSTLEQAWRASIHGLSAPLLTVLAEGRALTAVVAEAEYGRDPIAFYGIEAARRHRTRGITLGLFLGLMKSYRGTYLDLVDDEATSEDERRQWREVIENFFDRMEVGFCDEWANHSAAEDTEQLRTQNRLITNEKNRYLTIFESLDDPVFLIGANGLVENMNHAAAKHFAVTRTPGAGYYGDARPDLAAMLGFDVETCREPVCERELDTRIGRRWFDIRRQRMLDVSEKYLGTVVILVDVTEYRKAKEEAEAANRAKSTFLATMSHEIRTPIHGILGIAELLQASPLDDTTRERVDAVGRSAEILSSVVADILDYSKIEAGILDLEHVEFSVAAVVDDVVGLMRPIARRKPDLDLIVDLPVLPSVVGDPGKLRQILLNLVGNAVKFTPAGSVRLSVEDVGVAAGERNLCFTVTDTGIGIAPERRAAIFEPFTQSDGSVARRFGGTGLGLTICRRLVDLMGGRMSFDSRLGEGSRFGFTVPFAPGAGRSPTPANGPRAATQLPMRALDVLVVEDTEVNALVARGLLERAGHRPMIVSTGEAAVAAAGARDFDVVLMDIRLPDIDGLETTRRIRRLADPRRAAVPIVAASAQALPADVDACLAAGMNDFLGKPFRARRLEDLLRRVVGVASPGRRACAAPSDPVPDAVVDRSVLDEHVAVLGFEAAARIVETWRTTTASVAEDLGRASAKDARTEVAEIAHRLKSSSRHVGLVRLSDRAARVERTARGEATAIAEEVRDLVAVLAAARAALDATWGEIAAAQPAKT